MTVELIRTFHPIGQGAFYSERHISKKQEFNIIYDCGSTTLTLKKLEKKIKSSFPEGQIIDILFISHFHSDHINGIQFLKSHCKIKKVVLPLLDEPAKTLLKISNFISDDNTSNQLIDNPQEYFGNSTIVISIANTAIVDGDNGINTEPPRNITDITSSATLKSGIPLISPLIAEWFFIPFNYNHSTRTNLFISELLKVSLKLTDIDTIEKIAINKKEIIEAYKQVDGDLNINSMILYSGKQKEDNLRCFGNHNHFYYDYLFDRVRQSGCLFLGDIDLKQNDIVRDIKAKLVKFLPHIGTLQIPHHGSIHNFNITILDNLKIKCAIFSFGSNNTYGHPSDRVISEVVSNEIFPHFVTEDQNSIVTQWK